MKLTKEELGRIEAAVESAEKRTSGEIVVMTVARSDRYRWVHALWAASGALLATMGLMAFESLFHFPLPLWEVIGWQLLGASFAGALSFLPALFRLTIPRAHAAQRVHRESLAHFLGLGLTETRERTGVLIYVSEIEHRVVILADRGIDSVCGQAYWDTHVKKIAAGMRERRPVEAIVETIERIGERLAEKFPRRADDTNELSNQVRTDS